MVGAEKTLGVPTPVNTSTSVCAPMSTMEEENLRERLHVTQLRQCAEIVGKDVKYSRDTFRRLFQGKVLIFNDFFLFLIIETLRFLLRR